ncbi:hypothetical protein C0V97_01245 [Asaia sp. W19]|uniref:hypothetical protein n=1 Tax=unclassified Asaia TaxID=2685023 RepID=UPI000F8F33A0|nr:hypothetical protein [Asaia sp. W19]RUT27424.1 hypothetical protein C0V97_01245 [Asaia sp. W19]
MRRRQDILQEEAVVPTPERMKRDRFRKQGDALKVLSTVIKLQEAGDIGDDEVAAATRWRKEYDFAVLGVVDSPDADRPVEKGDIHTWMLGRGKCAERLRQLSETLGTAVQARIDMMLVREMSFPEMARLIYPAGPRAQARTKTVAQCALALEQLSEYYKNKKY